MTHENLTSRLVQALLAVAATTGTVLMAASVGVLLPSLAPVIKATSPAVVNIATRGTLTERVPGNPCARIPTFAGSSMCPRADRCGGASSRAPARE
jgi:S1-C subfamily serine protease